MDDSTTMRVVSAVAEATDRDVSEMPPLAAVVDTDALESLFETDVDANGHDVEVEFAYAGRQVLVRSGGRVTVGPPVNDVGGERPG